MFHGKPTNQALLTLCLSGVVMWYTLWELLQTVQVRIKTTAQLLIVHKKIRKPAHAFTSCAAEECHQCIISMHNIKIPSSSVDSKAGRGKFGETKTGMDKSFQ